MTPTHTEGTPAHASKTRRAVAIVAALVSLVPVAILVISRPALAS